METFQLEAMNLVETTMNDPWFNPDDKMIRFLFDSWIKSLG